MHVCTNLEFVTLCPCNSPASSILPLSEEDCQVFTEVLDSVASKNSPSKSVDIPAVLAAYNDRRHGDAIAVCSLSEIGMGGARSMRPAFAAQLLLTTLLSKTLGLFAPQVLVPELCLISCAPLSLGRRNNKQHFHPSTCQESAVFLNRSNSYPTHFDFCFILCGGRRFYFLAHAAGAYLHSATFWTSRGHKCLLPPASRYMCLVHIARVIGFSIPAARR